MGQRRTKRRAAVAVAGAVLCSVALGAGRGDAADEPDWIARPVAVLQGLDKVTARISTVTAPVGETVGFGTLLVTVETCQEHPPTLPPESAAFMVVDDQPPDEQPRRVFSGWMFASSPGLHALEHPVYDVWVLSCRSAETAGQSSAPGTN
ncbi:DUF2155 domain-containing protein [Thalassobaculum sp.]|uniref:DUF2155 domain-containing protein n=1 Tax=Thalassobaculum sp. TaxID=2022740 RepID=UPI0032EB9E3A